MIKRSLLELAVGEIFSGAEHARLLREFLTNSIRPLPSDDYVRWCAQRMEHLVASLDGNHARRFRRGDMNHAFTGLVGEDMFDSPRLPMMDELFERLMVRNGDLLQYRDSQVQAYARLAVDIDPTLIAGWHLSGWLANGDYLRPFDFKRIVAAQRQFFAPPAVKHKVYAEGHVHLGGIAFDGIVLASNLLNPVGKENPHKEVLIRLQRLLCILLDREQREGKDRNKGIGKKLASACEETLIELPGSLSLYLEFFREKRGPVELIDSQWLLTQLANALASSEAWMWLVLWLWHTYRDEQAPTSVRVAVFYFFTELMVLRKELIMDGQGLTRFSEDFAHPELGQAAKSVTAQIDCISRMMSAPGDVAEFKVSPSQIRTKVFAKMANAVAQAQGVPFPEQKGAFGYPQYQGFGSKHQKYLESIERWHFCMHFSRSGDKKKYDSKGRRLPAVYNAPKHWKSARDMVHAMQSRADQDDEVFLGGLHNPNFHFQPSSWLRGLDVAGDENALRIEWFAPVLRWLRSYILQRDKGDSATPGFHLSVHAGEDYAHPLSGMRHVDETVRFCSMRSGDRLGHALALGIEPRLWAERQGDMILPVDEHLDNLVWLWHYACELSGKVDLASQVISRLERRIARVAPFVDWCGGLSSIDLLGPIRKESTATHFRGLEQAGPSPDILFKAWQLRRNCYHQFEKNYPIPLYDEEQRIGVPDYEQLVCAQVLKAYSAELSKQTPACFYMLRQAEYSAGRTRPVRMAIVEAARSSAQYNGDRIPLDPDAPFRDTESPEELEFMRALQDYLLDEYDRQGLIIEVNPTSNLYIARLETYCEHPIFRWNPPDERELQIEGRHNPYGLRRGPIRVLINTDDPGVMPTTLRTEFELVREAAIDLGYSRTVAEDWLERLRQFGVEQFYRNHQAVFSVL
ncbi:antiviral RADAR system adenosine deaminase RdrB [Pseudomonas wadenswilerensis]|uniref:antiviral RADAR system adenosine deaminase RdrB n=1 Tax=Pseudomonas wadenswilerensis TaxID=1785161 RepID=UPI00215EA58E|nr:antiviral RADAR system adenosine deaminase RdrB [Pseudomonas wadenswilerensis]UVM20890.1 hypothetical protein LOY45_20990 [Pseudomonas wadenswilerensis]